MNKLIAILALVVLAGCSDPYLAARSTIKIGRGIVEMSQVGFDVWVQVETDKCKASCVSDPDPTKCLSTCLSKVVDKAVVIFKKVKLAAIAGFDEADVMVNVSEKMKKKEPVNWLEPFQKGACFLARMLDFCDEATKKKILGLIELLGTFGCSSPK